MSDKEIVLGRKAHHDEQLLCDTHHFLKCLLIELGEPWKDAGEDESPADFIYFSTLSWSALFKRAGGLMGCDDVVAKVPTGWSKGGAIDLLFNKRFVRQYYPVLADEIAKITRRTGERLYATDEAFKKTNLEIILRRAGKWGGSNT